MSFLKRNVQNHCSYEKLTILLVTIYKSHFYPIAASVSTIEGCFRRNVILTFLFFHKAHINNNFIYVYTMYIVFIIAFISAIQLFSAQIRAGIKKTAQKAIHLRYFIVGT